MLLLQIYRRLDLLQRDRRFKIAVSALALLGCAAVFGALLVTSYRLDEQRSALVVALSDQNLRERDELAVSLAETGTVTLDGRTYGGPAFRDNVDVIFDEQGNVAAPAALAERLLADQRPAWMPAWMLEQPGTTWLLALVVTAWLQAIVWLEILLPFLLTVVGTAVPVAAAWLAGAGQVMLALAGIGLLTFTFVLLSRLVLLLLRPAHQTLAVAHTVVKEASRTNVSLVFIVLLLVLLPLLPLWIDADSPLRFQIQTFISRSMGLTFFFAACMTLFLSCATVAFEIRDRQIWQLMTKPLNHLWYLVGKWLGVMSVNLVILLVSSISIFTFVQYLRQRPVAPGLQGQLDALAVRDEVLTARISRLPDYQRLTGEQLAARVEQQIQRDPELAALLEVPIAVQRRIAVELHEQHLLGQRTVPPMEDHRYQFSGLGPARRGGSTVTLRYRFHITRSDEHEAHTAFFMLNDDPNLVLRRTYVPTMSHVLTIPSQFIGEDGTLAITVGNAFQPPPGKFRGYGALNFELGDFEVLYKVGNFEPNFARAVLLNWVKLAFLSMLGIACSTFLSFSVACLLSFTVFAAGALGPFLADSLADYQPPPTAQMDWSNVGLVVQWAFQWFIKSIAEALVFVLRGFGEHSVTQLLVEGKYIGWSAVTGGLLKLGAVWSGLALLVGWLVIRSRQLAIYSGQG